MRGDPPEKCERCEREDTCPILGEMKVLLQEYRNCIHLAEHDFRNAQQIIEALKSEIRELQKGPEKK